MNAVRDAVLRTLCFHAAWEYAPTLPELVCGLDIGNSPEGISIYGVEPAIEVLMREGKISVEDGRYGLSSGLRRISALIRDRDALQPRKRRAVRSAVRLLVRMRGVRFVALANTTALGSSRDGGDLDLFVIGRDGSLWTVRLLTAGPLRLMGKLPTTEERPDAVCLSYFISDRGLTLSAHMLSDDDPYYRHWFLSLLPLFDDGIGESLWLRNQSVLRRHPFARQWSVSPDLRVRRPWVRIGLGRLGERLAEIFQRRWFPSAIRERQNKGTDVIVRRDTLKFHVDDQRIRFKHAYETLCHAHAVQP